VEVARNKSVFFAGRIHKTIPSLGTDDRALINLILLRSEIDLGNIAQEYERIYGVIISNAILGNVPKSHDAQYIRLILDIFKH
jgi:annexin A7/11